jgi:hypothetical protein
VADIVKIDAPKFHIELVSHPVVADTQLEFVSALETLVRTPDGRASNPREKVADQI